jgi:hypothetical protein
MENAERPDVESIAEASVHRIVAALACIDLCGATARDVIEIRVGGATARG